MFILSCYQISTSWWISMIYHKKVWRGVLSKLTPSCRCCPGLDGFAVSTMIWSHDLNCTTSHVHSLIINKPLHSEGWVLKPVDSRILLVLLRSSLCSIAICLVTPVISNNFCIHPEDAQTLSRLGLSLCLLNGVIEEGRFLRVVTLSNMSYL